MSRFPLRICLGTLCCSLFFVATAAQVQAAPHSEDLLPDTTKFCLSIGDVGALRESFKRSQWGQLVNDPVLQPFVEDFRNQMREKGIQRLDHLGFSWEELSGVPGGEASLAMIQPAPGQMAIALVVDVTGHKEQATALLEKVSARLKARGAERLNRGTDDAVVVFQLPRVEGRRDNLQVAYVLQDDLLVATDNLEVLESIQAARKTERKDSLAKLKSYHSVMDRCQQSAGTTVPQLRWFVDLFGYIDMLRSVGPHEKRHGIDIFKALKNQGFTAIQGVGGYVNFSTEGCELIHRTMIYAPPVAGHEQSKDKYELAARMLNFPAGGNLEPQPWVPAHVATYNTFNWDIQTAFNSCESLVDELMAEKGVMHDVLDSLKNDPQGPKVDIAKDLVGNLKSRVTIITDYQLPIGPKSERILFAVETGNEAAVAEAIAKTMKGDARRREFEGHLIWEVTDEQCEVPELKIESPDGSAVQHADQDDGSSDPKRSKDDRLMPNSAMTVAFGHLFVASHIEFLEEVLRQNHEQGGLATCADYRLVAERANRCGTGQFSFRLFSRTDEEYRPTYELIRTGQMPKSETILGQGLNAILGDGKDGQPRKQKIDGRLLPPFDAVSHYFGPASSVVTSEPSGWFVVGFTLDKSLVKQSGSLAHQATSPEKTPAQAVSVKSSAPKSAESNSAPTAVEPAVAPVDPATAAPAQPAVPVTVEKSTVTTKK